MRLLLLTNNLTGGAVTNQFIDLSSHLSEYHEVYVGALLGGVDDTAEKELVANGASVVRFSFGGADSLTASKELYRFLNDNVDILNTHLVRAGIVGRIFAAAVDIPVVVSTQQKVHPQHNRKQRLLKGLTLPLADGVTSISETVADSFPWWVSMLLNHTVEQRIIHNAVDPGMFASPPKQPPVGLRQHFESEAPAVISVGRLIPVKNHELLIDATAKLTETHPDVRTLIVGDGDRREELERRTERRGVADNVIFTGWLHRSEVAACVAAADVFAMPSRAEGLGVALIEAMIAAAPVVISDIPVFHEVVGDTGLFASLSDPVEWARTIETYVSDEALAQANGTAAQERARQVFSPERVSEGYLHFYATLLS